MKIWVDADACPSTIRDILFKAAMRTETEVTLVANKFIKTPRSSYINSLQVPAGFDAADQEIVKRLQKGDLVITGDIPLADEVIALGGVALSPRGMLFTKENIKVKLNMRDFMETLRSSGVQTGGPTALSLGDRKEFAGQLDKWLVKKEKRSNSE